MDTAKASIEDIAPPSVPASTQADPNTLQEQSYLEKSARDAELESFKQDVKHRAEYAPKIFILVVVWVVLIFGLLIFQGFSVFGFHLSDSVLIAAISGTTLNILGLFVIVANYIFRKQ